MAETEEALIPQPATPEPAAVASSPDEATYPFEFEQANRGAYRSPEAARPGVLALLGRLGVSDGQGALGASPAVEKRLLLLGTEVLLNIKWYQDRAASELKKQQWMNRALFGMAGALVVVTGALFWMSRENPARSDLTTQLGAIVAVAMTAVKFVTDGRDYQKTRSSFWRAGSDLKERLYNFITAWHGKAVDPAAGGFTADFVLALEAEIKAARDIQSEERERFYGVLDAPSTLLGRVSQLQSDVQGQLGTLAQAGDARRAKGRARELEQLKQERENLLDVYPKEAARPLPVRRRILEIEGVMKRMAREQSLLLAGSDGAGIGGSVLPAMDPAVDAPPADEPEPAIDP